MSLAERYVCLEVKLDQRNAAASDAAAIWRRYDLQGGPILLALASDGDRIAQADLLDLQATSAATGADPSGLLLAIQRFMVQAERDEARVRLRLRRLREDGSVESRRELANLYLQRAAHDRLRKILQPVLASGANGEDWFLIYRSYRRDGMPEQATAALETLVRDFREHPLWIDWRIERQLDELDEPDEGKHERKRAALEELLATDLIAAEAAAVRMALVSYVSDSAAAEHCEWVLEHAPTSRSVPTALAGSSRLAGRTPRAIELLERLIREFPRSPEAQIARPRLKYLRTRVK